MQTKRLIKPPRQGAERGSALLAGLVVLALLLLLALGLALVADEEARTARNYLRGEQASWAALGCLRCVRQWLENPDPAAGFVVPLPAEVNRTLRRVDPAGTGASTLWSSAPPPWNVIYRAGANDLFERPYRGSPALSFAGDSSGPDVSISRSGSAAEIGFLDRLGDTLFAAIPGRPERVRLMSITLQGPPVDRSVSPARRLGIATILVTVSIQAPGPGGVMREAAARSARGVLGELPYRDAAGGLLAAGNIDGSSGLDVRWGTLAARGGVTPPLPDAASWPSAWPRDAAGRVLVSDADGDGVADDRDADGTADFTEWLSEPGAAIEDPWFFVSAGSAVAGAPVPAGPDDRPWPFDPAVLPSSPALPWSGAGDRSDILQAAAVDPVPGIAWALWKSAARSGARGHRYYAFDPASGQWRRDGTGPPETPDAATRAGTGLWFFDTTDGNSPTDTDSDGTPDNLGPACLLGAGWNARGVLVLAAASLLCDAVGPGPASSLTLPGEPCTDRDGDRVCGAAEPFLRLTPPIDPLASGATFVPVGEGNPAMGPARASTLFAWSAPIAFEGLLLQAGDLMTGGDATIFGGVVLGGSVIVPAPGPAGVLQVLHDARLDAGLAPAPSTGAPRTFFGTLQREPGTQSSVAP